MKDVNELKKIKSTPFSRWLLGDIDAQIKQREENLKEIEHRLVFARNFAQLHTTVGLQRIVIAVLIVLIILLVTQLLKNILK